jgi:hypothetical protein
MAHVTLNQSLKRIEISDLQIENELAFAFFDALPADERDAQFIRALQIGILALKQDRLSSFLAKTTNELGTELESLKMLFDMKAELFARSAVKGTLAEADIADYLAELTKENGHTDRIELTGNAAGAISRNKTGDILCYIDDADEKRIVIECKFDKSMRFGAIEDQDWYGKKLDTALGQLVEAQANRECTQAIIVFDKSSINPALLKRVKNITYEPQYGFLVVVDSLRGDYSNLGLAYLIARELACADRTVEMEADLLTILLDRIISEAEELAEIRKLVESNISNSIDIIAHLEKGVLSLEFCRTYLKKFLNDGTLSKADLLDFYSGGDRREKYRAIQQKIETMSK